MSIVVKEVKVSDLIPYDMNAKIHSEMQVSNVANSIKRFGWRQPLVVDANNVVIIGHCRLLAAKRLGLETVPVTYADDLTDEEIQELRIVDNKLNESPWDYAVLKDDISDLGFDGFEPMFDDLFEDPGDVQPKEKKEPAEKTEEVCRCPRCGAIARRLGK